MKLINPTNLEFALMVGTYDYPQPSLTVIVKGTYSLVPGDRAVLAEEQLPVIGDDYYEDDEEMTGPGRYASDFAFFKPRADLMLVGNCHVPRGKPQTQCSVTFQVGSISKDCEVFGDRHWSLGPFSKASDPVPFSTKSLRYENSFGGEEWQLNPIGKGVHLIDSALPLPNIEDPQALIGSKSDRPHPAGFAPLGQSWEQRHSKIGTFNEDWLKNRWPWYPTDFDWGFFNAAQPDLQCQYLAGDERLFFKNVHPKHGEYRSQLPEQRVRCFLNENGGHANGKELFREVPLVIDTLWVDMEQEILVLVWRGVTDIRSRDHEEISHIMIRSDSLQDPNPSQDECRQEFRQILADAEAEFALEEVEPIDEIPPDDSMEQIEAAELKARQELIDAGIDPDAPPPEPTPEQKNEEAALIKSLGIEVPEEDVELTREDVEQKLLEQESLSELDLSDLDLSNLDFNGADLTDAILDGTNFRNSNLSDSILQGANLLSADLSGAKLIGANLTEADFTEARLIEADLTGAVLDNAVFDDADLTNSQLTSVGAIQASFLGANFSRANLGGGDFTSADFSNSILDEADARESKFTSANMQSASGRNANFTDSDLTNIGASDGCDFSNAIFRNVQATDADWEEANLSGADFSYADMETAVFTSAILIKTNLHAANLKFAQFTKANLTKAGFQRCNLFEGSLEAADLTETNFDGANLYGVELIDTRRNGTEWNSANLKMTKLANGDS